MKILGIASLAACALVLAACGGGSSHASCKDEATTTAYMQKFPTDMTSAITSGKVDPSKASEIQADLMKIPDGVKEGDYGGICVKVDEIKKKYGI